MKKKEITNKGINRIPRTAGTTMLARKIHLTSNLKEKKKLLISLRNNILARYVHDGFRLNGQTVDINYLSQYLQIPLNRLIKFITKHQSNIIGLISGDNNNQETLRAVLSLALNNALADRGRILKQTDMLTYKQKDTYVPFLSREVNRLLETLVHSQRPFIEIVKALQPTHFQNYIMNQNQQANIGGGNSPGKAVGTDQAVDLIDQNRAMNLLEDPDAKQKLYQTYIENQEKLPEVIATKQKGFKHESALSQKKETLALTKHEHRRENDGEIIE